MDFVALLFLVRQRLRGAVAADSVDAVSDPSPPAPPLLPESVVFHSLAQTLLFCSDPFLLSDDVAAAFRRVDVPSMSELVLLAKCAEKCKNLKETLMQSVTHLAVTKMQDSDVYYFFQRHVSLMIPVICHVLAHPQTSSPEAICNALFLLEQSFDGPAVSDQDRQIRYAALVRLATAPPSNSSHATVLARAFAVQILQKQIQKN